MTAADIISKLQLKPHPEGGFYRETYRSYQMMMTDEKVNRHVSTAIYFLLENRNKSLFHRIKSDELWFFHQGEPLEIVSIQNSQIHTIMLGNNIEEGEVPQAVIPANTWFAAEVKNGINYSLVSCTVAPGFDFSDFELAVKEDLLTQYPHLEDTIEHFTQP